MNVSACLVTRGNVDMTEILATIEAAGIDDVRIWNNALEQNLGVYGRYAAVEQALHAVVYVQDDDCVLPSGSIRTLIAAYKPGKITANMPPEFRRNYHDSCLVGFGAVFDRDLPGRAFDRFGGHGKRPDVIFTTLTPRRLVNVPYRNLPWATGPDRNYRQRIHRIERESALVKARRVRDSSG